VTEASPGPGAEQARPRWGIADACSATRLPLALAFIVLDGTVARGVIVVLAALTDLLDGALARRLGPSRFGSFVDPVADRLFMACAFGVVAFSGALTWWEVVGVLIRDLVASVAFFVTAGIGRPASIPARAGGKLVTVGQLLTLGAFLLLPAWLRPMAWLTTGAGLFAIADYYNARRLQRRLGQVPATGKDG
jgi:phosphatidylglycerophosphate synthase